MILYVTGISLSQWKFWSIWKPDWDLQQLVCKKVLSHHEFDIVCLVLQVLASASGSFGLSGSQICIWDLQQLVCKKVLSHHEFDIVCLAYSRDDKFLVSVGEYT